MNTRLLIVAVALVSTLANAQRYTGKFIHSKVAIEWQAVMEMFQRDGISLELNGTNQTVIVDYKSFPDVGLPKRAAGIALGTNNNNGIKIVVNSQFWDYMSHNRRVLVLLHELGHDYFNLMHTDKKGSLMYPSLQGREVTVRDINNAYLELKKQCTK